MDLSPVDFAKLRDEFGSRVTRKNATLKDIREVVAEKLARMLEKNPLRMDYYRKYQEIVADDNREKDRVTVEDTFARLLEFAASLDAEERRAVEEGLTDDEYFLFQLLFRSRSQRRIASV
ncbi:MAG TPA: type I restriction enzyme endonuclease domain-containing protein [Vicinamibacterales bacterium]